MSNQANTALVEMNAGNYQSILDQPGIVMVECWAASCGACSVHAPIYAKVAEGHPQHTFAKLDAQTEEELTSKLKIVHIPTLMLYRDGILLFKQAGNFDEARLEDIVAQAEALDMDMVRADLEREQSGAQTVADE